MIQKRETVEPGLLMKRYSPSRRGFQTLKNTRISLGR
ncbi:hypothetical protein X975_02686, partial [Stegodyphus mimosarum]